jgi:RNA polymerase sigma factor (sigma-70 family)|tara:strand:+ start:231 stop:989 length:759 start_codon:yes stop_codon:yes gene_type:complete
MKSYHIQNYIRYKLDLEQALKRIPDLPYQEYSKKELIIKFMPLVENLARKFATSQQASGVMSIMDLIQEGNAGLIQAVDRIDFETLNDSDDIEKTIKSFLSKRIKGAIRRGIDINRGDMRIPEHKLNEIRKNFGDDKKAVAMFFNSVFSSIDEKPRDDSNMIYQIPDEADKYNNAMLNSYLLGLLKQHLNQKEKEVLRLSYGLNCEKHSADEIAKILGINGSSSYVRVSQLKKQAIDKLIDNVDHSQVIDFL